MDEYTNKSTIEHAFEHTNMFEYTLEPALKYALEYSFGQRCMREWHHTMMRVGSP